MLAAIIAMLVANSTTAEPPPLAVVGATRTLTKGATGCSELEGLLAVAIPCCKLCGLTTGHALFQPRQLSEELRKSDDTRSRPPATRMTPTTDMRP